MRPAPDTLVDLLAGPVLSYGCRVESWHGGELLGTVPVESGTITWKDAILESAEVKLTVPATGGWKPDGPGHPLSPYGQQLRVWLTVTGPTDTYEVGVGRFRITKAPTSGGTVQVAARDLGVQIEYARTLSPLHYRFADFAELPDVPSQEGLANVLAGLASFWIVDAGPGHPITNIYIERDRYAGVVDILQTWPAVGRFDEAGTLAVHAARTTETDTPPVVEFRDGHAGTVVDTDRTPVESSMYNACVVQWQDHQLRTRYTADWVRSGPMAWPATQTNRAELLQSAYGFRPGFYASKLIGSQSQALATAQATLNRWQRGNLGSFQVDAAPDPRLQVGDVVGLDAGDLAGVRGRVNEVQLPITAADATMRLKGTLNVH